MALLYLHGGMWLTDAACGFGVIVWWLTHGGSLPIAPLAVLSALRTLMGILFFRWARDVWKGCRLRAVGIGVGAAVIHTVMVATMHALR